MHSSIMVKAWQECDFFNRTYLPGRAMTLKCEDDPPKRVTIFSESYALANGSPVVQIKEQVHPVYIKQLEPI